MRDCVIERENRERGKREICRERAGGSKTVRKRVYIYAHFKGEKESLLCRWVGMGGCMFFSLCVHVFGSESETEEY